MVRTTNSTQLSIAQIDNTTIMPGNKSDTVSLHNVYHVPGIKKNLLSVSQLTTSENYVLFGPEDVKVYEDVKIIRKATIVGRKGSLFTSYLSSLPMLTRPEGMRQ